MEMQCTSVFSPGWIKYRHGTKETVLTGHWAALYRLMLNVDGEEKASAEFWSFFKAPEQALDLIEKSAYLSPQVSTPA